MVVVRRSQELKSSKTSWNQKLMILGQVENSPEKKIRRHGLDRKKTVEAPISYLQNRAQEVFLEVERL